MADLGEDFHSDTVEKSAFDGELIPNGTRALAYITSTEVKPTSAGKGLNCRWDIIEGPFERRVVFDFVNYQHEKAQTQTIGQQRLKAICDATAAPQPLRDTSTIEFKPCLVTIGVQPASKNKVTGAEYDARNTIKRVDSVDGASRAPVSTAGGPAKGAASGSTSDVGRKAADKPAAKAGWGNRGS